MKKDIEMLIDTWEDDAMFFGGPDNHPVDRERGETYANCARRLRDIIASQQPVQNDERVDVQEELDRLLAIAREINPKIMAVYCYYADNHQAFSLSRLGLLWLPDFETFDELRDYIEHQLEADSRRYEILYRRFN